MNLDYRDEDISAVLGDVGALYLAIIIGIGGCCSGNPMPPRYPDTGPGWDVIIWNRLKSTVDFHWD